MDSEFSWQLCQSTFKIHWKTSARGAFHREASTPSKLEFKDHLTKNTANNRTLYIHWVHDPKDISNRDLCDLYNDTIQPHTIFDKMIVALSRPKNLRDMLTCSRLALPEGLNLRDIINQCKQNLQNKEQVTNNNGHGLVKQINFTYYTHHNFNWFTDHKPIILHKRTQYLWTNMLHCIKYELFLIEIFVKWKQLL